MKTLLAIIGGLWLVGRISRRSPHHPVNSIPPIVAQLQITAATQPVAPTFQDTAQIQGSLIAGEGGGE